ncbi:glycosyltransferase family 34 protein, partial [Piromyces sp. E2]
LKNKTYDWIFWIDSDVILTNPNIKLESFLPPEQFDDINLVITHDVNGLNNGIFFFRVNAWSYEFFMKSYTYAYYNLKTELYFPDQSSMLHVLQDMEDSSHYIVVPQNWFNSY